MELGKLELERWKVSATQILSREFAEQADARLIEDVIAPHLILRITQTIWGYKVGERVVEWPADWWQALKDRWFPRWALARWPVVHARETIEARDLFPHLAVPPEARRAVILRERG